MPCFSLYIICPVNKNNTINKLNNIYINRHARENNTTIVKVDLVNNYYLYKFIVCDTDAVVFLRDLLLPFLVGYILYTATLELFYKNSRIQRPYVPPPRYDKLLKDVYWSAVQCE